jgi:hypothetical protein
MTRFNRRLVPLFLIPLLVALGCADEPTPEVQAEAEVAPGATDSQLSPEQVAFWHRLGEHCGNAYRGEVADATPYYHSALEPAEIVAHFLDCSPDRIHVALHMDEDRSRNWILTREGGTIRLKHDHRHEDGTEEEISQYGGDAPVPGLPHRQIFPADDYTAQLLPDRSDNFWFLDFVDSRTLTYGVHWPRLGHSIRIEFDLATEVDPPPTPWGY